jgi:VWFA-related protein
MNDGRFIRFIMFALTVAFAAAACARAQSDQPRRSGMPTFKSDAREVVVAYRAVNKDGRLVPGISANEIRIDDEGVQRKITSFAGDVALAQVVVAADVSGSMAVLLEPLQAALFTFADRISENIGPDSGDVLLSLLPFSDTAAMLVDRTPEPLQFKNAVARLRPSGATALIDAILGTLLNAFGEQDVPVRRRAMQDSSERGPMSMQSARKATSTARGMKRSRFLVIFTDAGENSSTHRWSDIASALLGQGVVIYSVIFDSGTPDSNVPKLAGITKESGGRVFRSKADDLKQVYEQIAKDIRGRYALTFSASDVQNPRLWRNIRISTTRPGIVIHARTGYCPESPCQKSDGTFVGGQPKDWNDILAFNKNAALVSSIQKRLQAIRFQYGRATESIVAGLRTQPILIERRSTASGKQTRSALLTHAITDSRQASVSVDSQVCGISVAPQSGPSAGANSHLPETGADRPVLRTLDPEVRLSHRPGAALQAASDDLYFQSQLLFYLADPSGRIPDRVRVQCNRPQFLVSDGLVEFAIEALREALKITPVESTSAFAN